MQQAFAGPTDMQPLPPRYSMLTTTESRTGAHMTDQDERSFDPAAAAAWLRLMGVAVTPERAQDLAVQVARIERSLWARLLPSTVEPWMPPAPSKLQDGTPC